MRYLQKTHKMKE